MTTTAATTPCQSEKCLNSNPPSRLECPTCAKLGIKGSFFCTQECFKAGWKSHKIIHNFVNLSISKNEEQYNPFPSFQYTGSLRPAYPLSPKRFVPDHIRRPDYADDGRGFPKSESLAQGQSPQILTAEEQEKMRTVCRLGREILDIAAAAVGPGITTDEIDEIVHNATIDRNCYPSPLNYRMFPKSVCTSINEVICHGIPDKRKLVEGDIINIDVSAYHDGFHADLNATYPVGEIDEESKKLIRTTREALDAAIAICKPGVPFRDIGKAIEPIAKKNGCSVVRNYTAHGVNQLFHGSPTNIPHYAKNKAIGTMKPGMTFTIEPMINLGTHEGVHWPDDWTCTTADGRRSAQFEETLLITETGVEVISAAVEKQ
ncbi:methionine aminopeptidase [Schizopora paradoxa]|uniref:Methionine aminopeptidase n=1 Tax=Schizopora paradoxa TaxID=27342 RepID=A0A0H2S3J5_9AGAM|nr:methionine aminopeptidase [Schizopora paradoxa]